MLDLIRHVADSFQINVVLSSHLLDEVERICDSAVIIGEGRTLAAGTLQELRGDTDSGLTLVVDGSDAQVATVVDELQRRGATVSVNGRHLTVDGSALPTAEKQVGRAVSTIFDHARDACVIAEVGIVRMGRRQLSLEDVFLEKLG